MSLKKKAQQVRRAGYKNSGQDSMLAHITPKEAGLLKLFGGSGRIDPKTKLPHFDGVDGINTEGDSGGIGIGFDSGSVGIGLDPATIDENAPVNFDSLEGSGSTGLATDEAVTPTDEGVSSVVSPAMQESPSVFEHLGKNALQSLMNIAHPGLAPTLAAITSNNPQQTGLQTVGNTAGGLMAAGLGLGPVGIALGGLALGSSMGNAAANMNPVTPEDQAANNAATQASATSTQDPFQGAPRGVYTYGEPSRNYLSDFFTNFAPGALNMAGQAYLPGIMDSIFGSNSSPESSTPGMGGGQSSFLSGLGDMFSGFNGSSIGNFVGNHAGDLASLVYGLYNSNKQQKQMQGTMAGLQGLYSPNGAYAQQLRSNLERQAAARGTRSDYGGREVALMADLAGKNAGLMPGMMNMQNQMDTNRNKTMMNTLDMFNKLGGGDLVKNGLARLFQQKQPQLQFNPNIQFGTQAMPGTFGGTGFDQQPQPYDFNQLGG